LCSRQEAGEQHELVSAPLVASLRGSCTSRTPRDQAPRGPYPAPRVRSTAAPVLQRSPAIRLPPVRSRQQARAMQRAVDRKARATSRPDALRQLLLCGLCGRRLQGPWNEGRASTARPGDLAAAFEIAMGLSEAHGSLRCESSCPGDVVFLAAIGCAPTSTDSGLHTRLPVTAHVGHRPPNGSASLRAGRRPMRKRPLTREEARSALATGEVHVIGAGGRWFTLVDVPP
jgi:hypothetical protein